MKILYVTAQAPWGERETFLLEEMLRLQDGGTDLLIIPRQPPKTLFHQEAQPLVSSAVWLPLINLKMVAAFFKMLLTRNSLWKVIKNIIRHSRTPQILIKNLVVLPKGVFIAGTLRGKDIGHIHAHWGSTPSTMAYIIACLTGISWSFTLHRWDIRENNILAEKVSSAEFVRCISRHGAGELTEIVGETFKNKIHIIHLGVRLPKTVAKSKATSGPLTIVVPADLIEVKGHEYLVEAYAILLRQGTSNFRCTFYGEGTLRTKLENLIKEKGLTGHIEMPGSIPHEKLMEKYRSKQIDIVVLPSIVTPEGEHEGIPVSLMEAMAYDVPVISTNTGAIPELLADGAGIIVSEKNPEALAKAIGSLLADAYLRNSAGARGYQHVKEEFNTTTNVARLVAAMKEKN
jgi:glycosyltransferase involved in cell wall biosynthesis